MSFDYKRFFRLTCLLFRRAEGTGAKLTPKRVLVLTTAYVSYVVVELATWLCFMLDDIFFPEHRDLDVEEPVFIVGNPRSGTTFLHRLMARDETNFTSLRLWQILFAPSITQRKLGSAVAAIDRRMGGVLHRLLYRIDSKIFNSNDMHRLSLLSPEEDEYLMIHSGSTIVTGLFFGYPEESYPFVYFDEQLSEADKERVMGFYHNCLQRHYHAMGGEGRRILSKNPYFAPKVDSLLKQFPTARIIYLARDPMSVIPSYASLSAHWWRKLGEPEERYPHMDYVLDATQHWYSYPVERLEAAPAENRYFVNFHEMVKDPEGTIRSIYDHFGMEITPQFETVLQETAEKARGHKSSHEYSLGDVGLTREQVLADYAHVFERWDLEPAPPRRRRAGKQDLPAAAAGRVSSPPQTVRVSS